jgi:hypothetical protein
MRLWGLRRRAEGTRVPDGHMPLPAGHGRRARGGAPVRGGGVPRPAGPVCVRRRRVTDGSPGRSRRAQPWTRPRALHRAAGGLEPPRGRARGRRPARTVRRSAEAHPSGNTATGAPRDYVGGATIHGRPDGSAYLRGCRFAPRWCRSPGRLPRSSWLQPRQQPLGAGARPRAHHSGARRLRIALRSHVIGVSY